MKRHLFPECAIVTLCLVPPLCHAGPFGFTQKESEAHLIARIGKSHVIGREKGTLVLDSAPKPDRIFCIYALAFSSAGTLLEVDAFTRGLVATSNDQMRLLFLEIKDP